MMYTVKKIIGWAFLLPMLVAACIMCLITIPFGILAFIIALFTELAGMRKGFDPDFYMVKEFAIDFAFFPIKLVLE